MARSIKARKQRAKEEAELSDDNAGASSEDADSSEDKNPSEDSFEGSSEGSSEDDAEDAEDADADDAAKKHNINAAAPPGFAQLREDRSASDHEKDPEWKVPKAQNSWSKKGIGTRLSKRKRTQTQTYVAEAASGKLPRKKKVKKTARKAQKASESTGASGAEPKVPRRAKSAAELPRGFASTPAAASSGAGDAPSAGASSKASVSPPERAKGASTKPIVSSSSALVVTPAAGELVQASLPVDLPSFQEKFPLLWNQATHLQNALLPKQIFEAAKEALVCLYDQDFFLDHCDNFTQTILGLIDRRRIRCQLGAFSVAYQDLVVRTVLKKASSYYINTFGMMACIEAYDRNCHDVINQFVAQTAYKELDQSLTFGEALKNAYDATKTEGFYMAIRNTLTQFIDPEPFVEVVTSFHSNPTNDLTKEFLVKCAHALLCVQTERVHLNDINEIIIL